MAAINPIYVAISVHFAQQSGSWQPHQTALPLHCSLKFPVFHMACAYRISSVYQL
jgi:hypothetical protein